MEILENILLKISFFDIIYIILTILSLNKCTKNGFILSVLSASKWLLAYLLTLFLFPKFKPFVDGIIDNEYVLNMLLGSSIFIIIIFIILLFNKGLKKAVTYSGMGSVDKMFGFFFGFVRAYIIAVCIFSTINIVYNFERWPINLDKSISFPWVEKGGNYLIKEFPSQKEHEDTKEKIENI